MWSVATLLLRIEAVSSVLQKECRSTAATFGWQSTDAGACWPPVRLGHLLPMAIHLSGHWCRLVLPAFGVVLPFLQPLPLSLSSASSQLAQAVSLWMAEVPMLV